MLAILGKVSSMISRKVSTHATKSKSCVTVRSGSLWPSLPPICCRILFEHTWATEVVQRISIDQFGGKQGAICSLTMPISDVNSLAARRTALNCLLDASSSSAISAACEIRSENTSSPRRSRSLYSSPRAAARISENRRVWESLASTPWTARYSWCEVS